MTAKRPIVALDIDGTLGDHFEHTVRFAEMWTGHPVKYDVDQGWPLGATKFQFHRAMGLSKHTYRQVKLAYRQGGMKRSMPCYDGASALTRALRKKAELWICTSRPYLKMDGIEPDTRHWLRRNSIQYDAMIYGDRKYHDLVKQVDRDRIIAVVDDLPEMCIQAANLHLPVIMISRPHNDVELVRQNMKSMDIPIAQDLMAVERMVKGMLDGR